MVFGKTHGSVAFHYYGSLIRRQCVSIVDLLAYLWLSRTGFHFHRLSFTKLFTLFPFRPVGLTTRYRSPATHLSYWYRPHTATNGLPILFIHGIGIGLYPYINFLSEINHPTGGENESEFGHTGILAVEMMPISFRVTHGALDKNQMCTELGQILAKHNYDRFVLVVHSYGSIISSFIMAEPDLRLKVASTLLVDPVNFLLHAPDVAYNFTAREPRHANEWQLWYFASKDPAISHTLGRRFFWKHNVMWKKDVEDLVAGGGRLTFSLAGRDLIVDTDAVRRHLGDVKANQARSPGRSDTKRSRNVELECCDSTGDAWEQVDWEGNGLDLLWFGHLDHGQVFDSKKTRALLIKVVQEYCQAG